MKILFFGHQLSRARNDHRSRALATLLEGVFDRGHHVVYVTPEAGDMRSLFPFLQIVEYGAWATGRDPVEAESEDASAIVVLSSFAEGPAAVDYLFELPVPAHAYYELEPWETLRAFDAGEATTAVRSEQIGAFDIVFSFAGGPAVDALAELGTDEVIALYETIDPAIWHPRSPEDEFACDLALVADESESTRAALDDYLLVAARALPSNRFLVAGDGWDATSAWPENVELAPSGGGDYRATIYSSARVVLVPVGAEAIDYALPIELLEPASCGAACAVVDRPGLASLFKPGDEILIPGSGQELVPYLTTYGVNHLVRLGHLAEKRVQRDYVKLCAAVKFEQRLARKFYRGHNG